MIVKFTHDRVIDYVLPGIPPTGRQVEIAAVVVAQFRDGKLASEHVYWDQASVWCRSASSIRPVFRSPASKSPGRLWTERCQAISSWRRSGVEARANQSEVPVRSHERPKDRRSECGGRGRADRWLQRGSCALRSNPQMTGRPGPLGRKAVAARMRRDDGRGRRIKRTSVTAECKRFSQNGHVGPFAGLPRDWRADADGMRAGHVAEDSGELLSSANQRGWPAQCSMRVRLSALC